MAEDAFEVVQVAPFTAAVRVGADEITAVRGIQATHFSTLWEGRGDIRARHPVVDWPSPTSAVKITSFILVSKPPKASRCQLHTLIFKNKLVFETNPSKS